MTLPRFTSMAARGGKVRVYENVAGGIRPLADLTPKQARELAAALLVDAEAVELAQGRKEPRA